MTGLLAQELAAGAESTPEKTNRPALSLRLHTGCLANALGQRSDGQVDSELVAGTGTITKLSARELRCALPTMSGYLDSFRA